MIDYSSSARDVPSSTPTAHRQTKRTPFFFPPPCFSPVRAPVLIRPRFYLPRGHRPWTVDVRTYGPTRFLRPSIPPPPPRARHTNEQPAARSEASGLFCEFTERQIEVTYPKRLLAPMATIHVYILFRPTYARAFAAQVSREYRQKCTDIKNAFGSLIP